MTDRNLAVRTAFAALSLIAGTTFCTGIASAEEVAGRVAAPAGTTATATATATAASPDQRVCVRDDVTGSRIQRTVCMTRGEWIRQHGSDPSAR